MKKTIITTAIILLAAIQVSLAGDEGQINKRTVASFKSDFTSAHVINWSRQHQFAVATFNLNGQVMMAYYNPEALLVAVVHHLPVDHLPILLLTQLKKNYSDYWVSGLYEAAVDGDSHYHLTLENGDQVLTLKSVNSTDWAVEKSTRKS
jgi:hypothetical protein